MDKSDATLEYGFYVTLNEVLLEVIDHIDGARNAPTNTALCVHLKMASRAMRCALEIFGDRFLPMVLPKEDVK
jgi:hypothetical protein